MKHSQQCLSWICYKSFSHCHAIALTWQLKGENGFCSKPMKECSRYRNNVANYTLISKCLPWKVINKISIKWTILSHYFAFTRIPAHSNLGDAKKKKKKSPDRDPTVEVWDSVRLNPGPWPIGKYQRASCYAVWFKGIVVSFSPKKIKSQIQKSQRLNDLYRE